MKATGGRVISATTIECAAGMLMIFYFITIFVSVAEAATQTPSWWEHIDLMQVLIGGLFAIVLWFTARTLRKVDTNQVELFKRLNELSRDFYSLQGEHKAFSSTAHRG
jgi:hypothetical protein